MKRFISKKVAAIGLAVGVTLGAGGAAFAYFAASGTGGGSATVGGAPTLTLTANVGGALAPGTGAQAITVSGNVGTGADTQVATVYVKIGAVPTGCTAGDFTLGGGGTLVSSGPLSGYTAYTVTPVAVNSGAGAVTITSVPTISMSEDGNQTSCEAASIPLLLGSNS